MHVASTTYSNQENSYFTFKTQTEKNSKLLVNKIKIFLIDQLIYWLHVSKIIWRQQQALPGLDKFCIESWSLSVFKFSSLTKDERLSILQKYKSQEKLKILSGTVILIQRKIGFCSS